MFVNVIVLVFFIFLKFIFSACDSAFAYVNKYVILQKAKSGDKKSISIKKLLQNKSKMFGTIKVAITLIEFFMSAYAAEAFISWIKYYVLALVVEYDIVTNVSMVILTFILSYFSIVFGDIIPKRIGMNFPEKTLNRLIYPLLIVSFLIRPFEFILEKTTDLFCKIFGILQEPGDKLTEQELKYIISESKDDGVINTKSKQILLNTLKFDDLMVKNVMIKRDNVDFIDVNSSPKSIVANFKKYKFTRIPVYDKNIDNIVGILNVKDILYYYSNKVIRDELNIKPLLRKPFFVSKNEKVEDVFAIMKLNAISMAIVLDKNSSVEGIITVEDIVEKLVGDIFDEFDKK